MGWQVEGEGWGWVVWHVCTMGGFDSSSERARAEVLGALGGSLCRQLAASCYARSRAGQEGAAACLGRLGALPRFGGRPSFTSTFINSGPSKVYHPILDFHPTTGFPFFTDRVTHNYGPNKHPSNFS